MITYLLNPLYHCTVTQPWRHRQEHKLDTQEGVSLGVKASLGRLEDIEIWEGQGTDIKKWHSTITLGSDLISYFLFREKDYIFMHVLTQKPLVEDLFQIQIFFPQVKM